MSLELLGSIGATASVAALVNIVFLIARTYLSARSANTVKVKRNGSYVQLDVSRAADAETLIKAITSRPGNTPRRDLP